MLKSWPRRMFECGFMEGFTEEAQQQDSQMEEQEVMVTESTDAPCNPEETATQEAAAPEANRESLNEEADMHRKKRDELNAQTKEWKSKRDACGRIVSFR